MGVNRASAVTLAVAAVLFILTFWLVGHSRLDHGGPGSARYRRTLRRDIRKSPTEFRHLDQPVVRAITSDKSKLEARSPSDETKPPRKSSSGVVFYRPKVALTGTSGASDAETKMRKSKYKSATADEVKDRAPNVGTRMYFRSALNRTRKLNVTRMFRQRLKRSERSTLLKMFGDVTGALRAANVSFWMDGGTLLGSYRHHDLIPWDDNVDLVLRRSQRVRGFRAVSSLAPAYRLYVQKDADTSSVLAWHVIASNNRSGVSPTRRRVPMINLHQYIENSTHLWLEPRNVWDLVWRQSTVFPLHLRPFDRYWAPAPCNTRAYLTKEYRDPNIATKCLSPKVQSQRTDVAQRRIAVPCRTLSWLPLVSRQRDGYGSVVESLILGKQALRQYTIKQKC